MVPEGSIIYSDELNSYKCLGKRNNYTHLTVNHSKYEFQREETIDEFEFNVHINTIEAFNRRLKGRFKNIQLRRKERIKAECAVFNWKRMSDELYEPFTMWL